MKVVHNRQKEDISPGKAKESELEGELDKAASTYEKLIKEYPLNEDFYHRLMIIYRKQKKYKNELRVIRAGITAFEKFYQPSSHLASNKKIASLSRALLRSTGLGDKKGNQLYQKEPIGRWNRRRLIVEKKIKTTVNKDN